MENSLVGWLGYLVFLLFDYIRFWYSELMNRVFVVLEMKVIREFNYMKFFLLRIS